MKARLIVGIVLLFLLAIPFAAMSQELVPPGDGGKDVLHYCVVTPDHTQVLGGQVVPTPAGLLIAADQSPAVVVIKGPVKPR